MWGIELLKQGSCDNLGPTLTVSRALTNTAIYGTLEPAFDVNGSMNMREGSLDSAVVGCSGPLLGTRVNLPGTLGHRLRLRRTHEFVFQDSSLEELCAPQTKNDFEEKERAIRQIIRWPTVQYCS